MVQGSVEAKEEPGSNCQSFFPLTFSLLWEPSVAAYVSPKAREPRKYIQLRKAQSKAEEGRE